MAESDKDRSQWPYIDWLIGGEGDVNLGRLGPIECVAVATDDHQALAMLVRRPNESLEQLLTRLDDAVRRAVEEDEMTDEINP